MQIRTKPQVALAMIVLSMHWRSPYHKAAGNCSCGYNEPPTAPWVKLCLCTLPESFSFALQACADAGGSASGGVDMCGMQNKRSRHCR